MVLLQTFDNKSDTEPLVSALAMIETEYLDGEIWSEIYYEKELRQYSKVAKCCIKQEPFWAPARARATPAGDF